MRLRALWALLTVVPALVGCAGTSQGDVALARRESTGADRPAATTTTTIDPATECAATLTSAQLAAQLLMVLVSEPAGASAPVAAAQVGGLALSGTQRGDVAGQIAALDAQHRGPARLIVASDEEGGTVQRLRRVLGPYPSAADVARNLTPEQAGAQYEAYAREVAALGITMILGPSVDVGSGSALGSRTFGTDPAAVAAYGISVMQGIERAGLVPVVKHWPGIGHGDRDTHDAPSTLPGLAALRATDLVPFDESIAAAVPAIMVGHGHVPDLTGDAPTSLSSAAIDGELRGRQAYDGLVMTDSLGMGAALRGRTQPEVAELAIAAGADVAMVSGAAVVPATHARLVEAIDTGRLPAARVRDAVARSLRLPGNSCQPG